MVEKSKVYILVDGEKIIRCEGGYTFSNIEDLSQWIYIDEGYGDKYNLCQSHYLPKDMYEEHGIPVYKYKNGEIVERSSAEIQADIDELSPPRPNYEQLTEENNDMRNALGILGIIAETE